MSRFYSLVVAALLAAGPQASVAQDDASPDGLRVVHFDDGMSSTVYAYVRAEAGPILQIDDRGIVFNRDPALLLACLDGEVAVIYRYDTGLVGENDALRVQHRFAGQPSSETQLWPMVKNPVAEAEMELGIAVLTGADSAERQGNPLLEMLAGMREAARIPGELTGGFLSAGAAAEKVTVRVTDQVDGETHTDVFPLAGFSEALEAVKAACR